MIRRYSFPIVLTTLLVFIASAAGQAAETRVIVGLESARRITDMSQFWSDGEVAVRFAAAREKFKKGDWDGASAEVRLVAKHFLDEAELTVGTAKDRLLTQAWQLEQVAVMLKDGSLMSVSVMNNGFVSSHYALAEHYRNLSYAAGRERRFEQAWSLLAESARHVLAALKYPGQVMDNAANQVVLQALHAAARMVGGATWTSDELSKAFSSLGSEIERARSARDR